MKGSVALLLISATLGCMRRSDPVILRFSPPSGRTFRYETKIEIEQQGFLGLSVKADLTAAWSLSTTSSDENGVNLSLCIDGLDTTVSGLPFRDGDNERAMSPQIPKALEDGSLGLRLDGRGRVLGLVGIDRVLGDRAESSGNQQDSGPSILSALARGAAAGLAEQVARGIVQAFGIVPLPAEPVVPGRSWSDEGTITIPLFAQVTYDNRLELRETVVDSAGRPIHRIKEDITIEGQMTVAATPEGGLLSIEQGFLVGDVELDADSVPLAADVRWGFTFSATTNPGDGAAGERGVTVNVRAHSVTKRVAGKDR